MATDGSEAWPPPEVLEAADHEVTFAELVPEGIAVVDDTAAFAAAIANDDVVEPARRHFTADDFTVYVMDATAKQYRRVAEATVFVELPLPDGKAGWSGSGTLVRIPAARRELIGRRAPDDTFTSAGAGDTDVLALWTNWHVAHYPADATVGAHGMTADLRGSAGRNMSLVMDYAVGLKPVRLSAGDGAADILSFSPTVGAGGSDYALVRIPESDAPAYAKALGCAINIELVAHTYDLDIVNSKPAYVEQVLVGHPLGFAKRLSFSGVHATLSGGEGPRPGLVHHRCPSYGGSSGGPLMVSPSAYCHDRYAARTAGGALKTDVTDALVVMELFDRNGGAHCWSAVHWGSGGSSCLLRAHFRLSLS